MAQPNAEEDHLWMCPATDQSSGNGQQCTFISKLCLLNYTQKSKHSVNSAVSGAISSEQLASVKGQDFWEATEHTMWTACQQPPAGATKDKHQEIWEKGNHSWCNWADQIWQTPCIPRHFVRRETGRSPSVTDSAIASVLHCGQSSGTSAGVSNGIFPCRDSSLLCDWYRSIAGVTDYLAWNCKLLWRAVPSERDETDSLLSCKSHWGQEASHGDKPHWEIQPAGSGNPQGDGRWGLDNELKLKCDLFLSPETNTALCNRALGPDLGMNAILRSVTQAEQKVAAVVYRAESHLLSDHYNHFNYSQLEWNLIFILENYLLMHLLITLEETLTGPGRAAAPGTSLAWMRIAPQVHTVSLGGTGMCSDQTLDTQRRGFSHHWGCSTQWTIPCQWAGEPPEMKRSPTTDFSQFASHQD